MKCITWCLSLFMQVGESLGHVFAARLQAMAPGLAHVCSSAAGERLSEKETEELMAWMRNILGSRVANVKVRPSLDGLPPWLHDSRCPSQACCSSKFLSRWAFPQKHKPVMSGGDPCRPLFPCLCGAIHPLSCTYVWLWEAQKPAEAGRVGLVSHFPQYQELRK